jgi:hypothetical protein
MLCPRRFIALTLILLATLLSVGFVHGLWTDRWISRTSQKILEMEKLPLIVGAWEGKPVHQDADEQVFPDPGTFLMRRYVNHNDGTAASVMLTRGRPGPMAIRHLPTECYPSSGYQLVGQPKRFLSPSPDNKVPDQFWVATFKKGADDFPVSVRVYWSWSATGLWQAPDRPRVTFARHWMLYKLYVVQNIRDENEESEGAPVHDLIKELTSAMRSSIFSSVPK